MSRFGVCGDELEGSGKGSIAQLAIDTLYDFVRCLAVTRDLHGLVAPALGGIAEGCRIAKHLEQGNGSLEDHTVACDMLLIVDLAPP